MSEHAVPRSDGSKRRRRWPNEAEWARLAAMSAAREARKQIQHALELTEQAQRTQDPKEQQRLLAEAKSAQAQALAQIADIQRLLVEAKIGRDEDE